jgi:hypothetical protein
MPNLSLQHKKLKAILVRLLLSIDALFLAAYLATLKK